MEHISIVFPVYASSGNNGPAKRLAFFLPSLFLTSIPGPQYHFSMMGGVDYKLDERGNRPTRKTKYPKNMDVIENPYQYLEQSNFFLFLLLEQACYSRLA
jgi:hypothetical protein